MRRRHLLAVLSAGTPAGCADSVRDRPSDGATGSPATGDGTATDCTPPDYPTVDLPTTLTRSFAAAFERRWARWRAEQDGWEVDGTDGGSETVRATDRGFRVRVTVRFDARDERVAGTETETLFASINSEGRYRVIPTRAWRAPGDGGTDGPWTVVACE